MADETTENGTVFYRVSDRVDDSINTKDITLHTAFADLSDGTSPVLNVKAGMDSRLALLDFRVKPQPTYGGSAQMVGFDFNFVTTGASTVGNSLMQENPILPLCDLYLMKEGEHIEAEGAMEPVDDAHITYSYAMKNNTRWTRANVAAVLSHASYDNSHRGLHEDFSGTSDIGDTMYKYTTTGKVFAGNKPYIPIKTAVEERADYAGKAKNKIQGVDFMGSGGDAAEIEMTGFYGSTNNDGDTVVFLEPADDGSPPAKWKPANPVGGKQDLLSHPAFSGSTTNSGVGVATTTASGAAVGGGTYVGAKHGVNSLANTYTKQQAYKDPHLSKATSGAGSRGSTGGTVMRTRTDLYVKGAGKHTAKGMTTSSARAIKGGGTFWGKASYVTKGAPMKVAGGPVAVVAAAGIALYGGYQRSQDIKGAMKNGGDFSGLNRPYFEPIWKNKDIKSKIKYDKVFEDFTINEFDETAMTTTSSWWDQIKEVSDYPKPSIGAGAGATTSVTPGAAEDMMAKSSINFSNENTLNGGNMRMQVYHDKDISNHPTQQIGTCDFGGTVSKVAQDIYVSKHNLPVPVKFYPDGFHGLNSATNKEPRSKYEISFKVNITDMAHQYHINKQNTAPSPWTVQTVQPFKRGIVLTFSNEKPKENDCFADYIQRHGVTSDGSNWTKDMCGFFIEAMPSAGQANPSQGCKITPIAQVKQWDGDAGQITVHARESTISTNDIYFARADSDSIQIPMSTWLEFKLSTDASGASGQNYRRHGRFYLSVHHANSTESGELVDDQKEDGAYEGPMCLVSPNDCADGSAATDHADRFLTNAHGDIDEPLNTTHWLKHMTLWMCNIGNNSGGSFISADPEDGPIVDTGDTVRFGHDSLSQGFLAKSTNHESTLTPTGYSPYFLAKVSAHFDDFKIKNASPSLVNMSVNSNNTHNTAGQNAFNNDNINIIKPAHEPYWDNRPSDNTHNSKSAPTPTTLALGFKTVTNLVGSTSDPKFLLFNDFKSANNEKLPGEITGSETTDLDGIGYLMRQEMMAGYQTTAKRLGDWNDIHSLNYETLSQKTANAALDNTNDGPITFNIDNGHDLAKGDILRMDDSGDGTFDEYLVVTNVASDAITVNRAASSGSSKQPHGIDSVIRRYGQSLFKTFSIGNTADNDIMTGAADTTDLAYANATTAKTMYVNGFSQKGVLQIQNAFSGWTRRENIYASSRITGYGNFTDAGGADLGHLNQADNGKITIADRAAIAYDEDELYIVYKWGSVQTGSTCYHNTTGTASIVKITAIHDDTIEIARDISLGELGGGSGHKGCQLDRLLTEANLPYLFISPFRYWMCLMFDTQKGPYYGLYDNPFVSNSYDYPAMVERSYGSVIPVADPSSGYTVGTTFNERNFSVNTDGKTYYDDVRTFDITQGDRAPYELGTDFGYGVFDQETASGGQLRTFRPTKGSNRINIDALAGARPKEGDKIGILMSASGNNSPETQVHFFSSDVAHATFDNVNTQTERKLVPQLVTKYFKPMPSHPGLAVQPNEINPQYPEFTYAVEGSDLWYGYLMLSKDTIYSKYHGIVAYCPLNEDTDNSPWNGVVANYRGANLGRLKLYGNEASIGQEGIPSSNNVDITYATADGVYDSAALSCHQSLKGLAGRCLDTTDSALTFPHFAGRSNQGNTGSGFSLVIHTIPNWEAADGVIYEVAPSSGVSSIKVEALASKVKVTVGPNSGTATVLTSPRSLPRDGETPCCIIVTCDPDITESNVKLFMDGKLEAQSGPMAVTPSATQWGYDKSPTGTGSNDTVTIGPFKAKYEEIILYGNGTIIYPVTFEEGQGDGSVLITKNLEEVANDGNGAPQIYNARMFVFDYHNLRGNNVATSQEISFRKTSFKIDGT